jgi:hypothetical protein
MEDGWLDLFEDEVPKKAGLLGKASFDSLPETVQDDVKNLGTGLCVDVLKDILIEAQRRTLPLPSFWMDVVIYLETPSAAWTIDEDGSLTVLTVHSPDERTFPFADVSGIEFLLSQLN